MIICREAYGLSWLSSLGKLAPDRLLLHPTDIMLAVALLGLMSLISECFLLTVRLEVCHF